MPREVRVNELTCELHGKCQDAAPEVFRLADDDEWSQVLLTPVPDELHEQVERAILTCPRQAIAWVEA
jgi:ferredoxin